MKTLFGGTIAAIAGIASVAGASQDRHVRFFFAEAGAGAGAGASAAGVSHDGLFFAGAFVSAGGASSAAVAASERCVPVPMTSSAPSSRKLTRCAPSIASSIAPSSRSSPHTVASQPARTSEAIAERK